MRFSSTVNDRTASAQALHGRSTQKCDAVWIVRWISTIAVDQHLTTSLNGSGAFFLIRRLRFAHQTSPHTIVKTFFWLFGVGRRRSSFSLCLPDDSAVAESPRFLLDLLRARPSLNIGLAKASLQTGGGGLHGRELVQHYPDAWQLYSRVALESLALGIPFSLISSTLSSAPVSVAHYVPSRPPPTAS